MPIPTTKSRGKSPEVAAPMQHVPGLDYGVLDELTGYALRRAQNALYLHFDAATAQWQLSPQRFAALVLIDRNPGLAQGVLSDAMGINRSGAMRLVDWLESNALVVRIHDKEDARRWGVQLTQHGKKKLIAMTNAVRAHDALLVAKLGDDGPRLKPLLEALATAASER
ncbi:MAG: MarR family winged helix-turn-helix transcriptional regulator [Casimicrobium sp.]